MYKFKLITEEKLEGIAALLLNAYPAIGYNTTIEQCTKKLIEDNKLAYLKYIGAYNGDNLVGGFNVWDFEMNFRQSMIKAGGIGSVAVDLTRKKEKICFAMMENFIEDLRKNGRNIALLYPFNSAFYYKMGYGFGTLLQQFKLRPNDLPSGNSKANIVRLTEKDAKSLTDYYNYKVKTTHGLINKAEAEFANRLKSPAVKVFAYKNKAKVKGYLVCNFKKGSDESFLVNDLYISEMFFDSPEVFLELMTFVKSQADQVRYVIINTQDEGFINTLSDPRNHTDRILFSVYQECCQTGLGIMYRICDVKAFFLDIQDCSFGNLNMKVQFNIKDSFVKDNNKPFFIEFKNGKARMIDDSADVEINIDIAEFSSLIMGCANLKKLIKYGKAQISKAEKLEELSRAFSLDEKPVCVTHF
ncbi:MAG: GNAT family N-acetyltransferase [Erysipelotrichales bacterium]|nr:GNAT family N-acetyltransferase [Erysipelotrichales bacterium]